MGESEGDVDREVAALEGTAALPRRNGELVFQAPWEGRAFGMAVALRDRGVYRWDEFRELLVQRVAGGPPGYYESWLEAFEDLLLARGLIGHAELRARAQEFKDLRRDPLL